MAVDTLLLQELMRYDPGAAPDWRFQRVLEIIHRTPALGRVCQYDDKWVREARNFLAAYHTTDNPKNGKGSRRRLLMKYPTIYFAYAIHERAALGDDADMNTMLLVQARIIAGQSDEDIAKSIGTHPDVIKWYANLFFDVRPRLNQRDWIVARVLVPSLTRSPAGENQEVNAPIHSVETFSRNFLDGSLKYFGYYGGGEVIDTLLGGQRRDVSENATDEFLDSLFKRQLKIKTIQGLSRLPVNRYNISALMETYMQMIQIDKATGSSADESAYNDAMTQLLNNVQFEVGNNARDKIKQTPLAAYYDKDYELSHSEQRILLAGGNLDLTELEATANPLLNRESSQTKEVLADVKKTNTD
jgi:hypothetical protein